MQKKKLMSIDFGDSKVGIAIADPLPQPFGVFYYKEQSEIVEQIKKISDVNKIEMIIVGVSENQSGKKAKLFGEELQAKVDLPIEYFDETLSTIDAQQYLVNSGRGRKHRKEMEDAWAASVILERFLESN